MPPYLLATNKRLAINLGAHECGRAMADSRHNLAAPSRIRQDLIELGVAWAVQHDAMAARHEDCCVWTDVPHLRDGQGVVQLPFGVLCMQACTRSKLLEIDESPCFCSLSKYLCH